MMPLHRFLFSTLSSLFPAMVLADAMVHHDMQIQLVPAEARIHVVDHITLPDDQPHPLWLHRAMKPRVEGGTLSADTIKNLLSGTPLKRYTLQSSDGRTVTLDYAGKIHAPLETHNESMGKRRRMTSGIIDGDGVFLDGNSGWYPQIPNTLQTFSMKVHVPKGWLAVSQGEGPALEPNDNHQTVRWRVDRPQDDIYLVAAPFRLYRERKATPETQVYLRETDDALARRYLNATHRYIALYSRLIGPYPYAKFALVENFWETGYGMPSFTLLGPQVIRLPFILYSSYPHEILHNWWGNGVYVDYAHGNWSEGLTAYLADYALKERRGTGAVYRREALQRYASFVGKEKDFPLSAFRSRHSGASQAVGYDKALMVFHMLRRRIGDKIFIAGLRRFYQDNLFKQAGFDDLRTAFETVSGTSLTSFFRQWIQRVGAPALAVEDTKVEKAGTGFQVKARLVQTQSSAPFVLRVPVVLYREGTHPLREHITMTGRESRILLKSHTRPMRLDIDPAFDLFRQLAPGEAPPVLNDMFGAARGLILLPAKAPRPLLQAYQQLAKDWKRGQPGLHIIRDDQLDRLPNDRPVWLLGRDNRFIPRLSVGTTDKAYSIGPDGVEIEGEHVTTGDNSVALVIRAPQTAQSIAWIAGKDASHIAGLSHKLPHYGKYSYVVFQGDDGPALKRKGTWPVIHSPLKITLSQDVTNIPSTTTPDRRILLNSIPSP